MHWSEARRDSSRQSPSPEEHPDAIVQVFSARAWSWRGTFGVHTWIAAKRNGADHYRRYEVIGWRLYRGGSAVSAGPGIPDAFWFGSAPTKIAEITGPVAEAAITEIEAATLAYPYAGRYNVWPGPNSNTFTAFVARQVPALRLDLPPTAIGKDFLPNGDLFAKAPSGTGVQVSIAGLLGVMVAVDEGLEINVLGLTFGIDITRPALKLPGLGRLGV